MIQTKDITRPDKTATAAGELNRLGVKNVHMQGPYTWSPGAVICGPALTLQFMPKREDLYGTDEYSDPEKQLHRHCLYHTQPGDIVVVDARGDMLSGVFGEMMLTYFKGRGGAGLVVDGCIRDYTHCKSLGLPMWLRGVTPNFHTQTGLMPFAVNEPISCGNVLVMPGDIIVADDDGAIVVPVKLAPELVKKASEHSEWEVFSRMKLAEGGDLRKYYPLREDARAEYEAWRAKQSKKKSAKKK
jgi:regulator of RNase E activity RraA